MEASDLNVVFAKSIPWWIGWHWRETAVAYNYRYSSRRASPLLSFLDEILFS